MFVGARFQRECMGLDEDLKTILVKKKNVTTFVTAYQLDKDNEILF